MINTPIKVLSLYSLLKSLPHAFNSDLKPDLSPSAPNVFWISSVSTFISSSSICKSGSLSASSWVLILSLAKLFNASASRPFRTSHRGEGGRIRHPRARIIPGVICTPRGIRQDIGPGMERVMKPVQKPNTTPRTMDSCSSARSEPLTSGGLISAMYSGESMLSAPTPIPPIARPKKRWKRF